MASCVLKPMILNLDIKPDLIPVSTFPRNVVLINDPGILGSAPVKQFFTWVPTILQKQST